MWPTISSTLRDEDITFPKTMNDYDRTQPKVKTIVPLTPLQQSDTQPKPENMYHIALETPEIHEIPPKWNKNEDVLQHLKDDVKLYPSMKPRQTSKINDLVKAFTNTLNSLSPFKRKSKNDFLEYPPKIKPHHHIPVVPYYHQLCDSSLQVQQY